MLEESVKIAARSMLARRGRSFLTLSTIAIGCFAIVLASSLADSGFRSLKDSIEQIGGARLLGVGTKPAQRAEKKQAFARARLDETDRENLRHDLPYLETFSHYAVLEEHDVLADNGKTTRADLVGVDAGFFDLFHMRIAAGRPLDDSDDREATSFCVVGPKVAASLWSGSPLAHKLAIEQIRCRVMGVFGDNERWGTNFGFDWNNLVVVPFRTAAHHLPEVRQKAEIVLRTDRADHNDVVKRILNARMEAHHAGIDDFTLYDMSQVMTRFETVFALLQLLVALFAGIALVIGGAGIMNMMLVNVSERTKEIGIRKALGAAPGDLSSQFLVEASLLAGSGGALGAGLGAAAAMGAGVVIHSALSGWVPSVSVPAVTLSLVSAVLTGIAFGWLPAKKAARLDPVEAIRR
jgi:putative ABC transport system permease protein